MEEFRKIRQALDQLHVQTEEEWSDLSSRFVMKRFAKGDVMTRQGQVENYIYFLNKGTTRNFFLKDGKEFTVDFQFEGNFVTAFLSFITREPSPVSIELLEDAEVVVISYASLHEFYNSSHNSEKIGRLIAEYQYVKRLRREMELLSYSAEERYARLMQQHPELIRAVSVKHLSSYLGIAPESLSRIRKAKN